MVDLSKLEYLGMPVKLNYDEQAKLVSVLSKKNYVWRMHLTTQKTSVVNLSMGEKRRSYIDRIVSRAFVDPWTLVGCNPYKVFKIRFKEKIERKKVQYLRKRCFSLTLSPDKRSFSVAAYK